ncbi:MAG: PD-(D/E)XK nuclease family protein [Acidimicrobiia bacterium]
MAAFKDRTDPLRVSATLYGCYLQCPQQALARLRGVYPADSVAGFKGRLAHRVFARHLTDGEIAEEDFEMTCRRIIGESMSNDEVAHHLTMSEYRAMFREVHELYERFRLRSFTGFREAESEFVVESDDIVLTGRIDAIFEDDDGVRIVDWKTGTYLSDREPQLSFYAMAWHRGHDEVPVVSEAVSIATGDFVRLEPSAQSINDTDAQVAAMARTLQEALRDGTDLDRYGGPHCRWCPLLEDCTEGGSAVDLLDRPTGRSRRSVG